MLTLDSESVVMETARQSHSSNLRDLLRIKEENSDCVRSSTGTPSLTLRAILSLTNETTPAPPNRTLLDIILGDGDNESPNSDSRNTWESLRDRIRLPRRTEAISQTPASVQNTTRMISRQRSLRTGDLPFQEDSFPQSPRSTDVSSSRSNSLRRIQSRQPERALSRSVTRQNSNSRSRRIINWGEDAETENAEDNDDEEEEESESPEAEEQTRPEPPARMSLMSLLSVNDGSSYGMEEEEEEEEVSTNGGAYNNCCVCMVRHKGAAFIPCGHTFCRLCSRELWVQRGSCPLCNNYILEILDIF